MACTAAQAMQEYYRHPSSPRPPGANSGAGSGAGRGAPHASSSASASYATVRPLPTPQGWGGQSVTSPTLGSGGYSAGQQRGYSSGLKERRTSGSGQATDWRGGYAGYRRDGQTLTSPNPSSTSIPYQQRPHSPLPPVPHQQPPSSFPVYPSVSSPPPPSASPTSPIPRSHSPLPPSSGCMATTDHDSFVRVSLAGHTSSEAIKESIMTKLHIPDDDFFRYSLFLTPLGGGEGRQLGDQELWDVIRRGEQGSAVYAKMVIGSGSSMGGGGEEDGALPAGMSAERMRQVGRERAKERERAEQREREGSATSASGGGISSPTSLHSATAPVGAHPRRNKSPSISSRSDVSGGAGEFGERQRSPSSGGGEGSGLRSDRPSWTWSHGQRGEGHQRHGSASGGLSPPMSGGRDRAGSITPTAPEGRHDGEWAHSPPLASAGATQTFSTIRSPQPPPPIKPPPLASSSSAGSQQVVMGPSGPTRRLPPQPGQPDDRRTHTIPGPNGGVQVPPVSAQPWSRSVPPPQAPQPRTLASHPHPHPHPQPPPIITRPLPPTDPRSNLPQYQPYVSGQPQASPAMFHNIALQGASPYPSYSPNPSSNGTNSFSPPLNSSSTFSNSLKPDRTVVMSKSADNLRGHYAQAFDHDLRPPPIPPQPPTAYRGAGGTPNGHPGAMGSRPYPPQPPQHPQSSQPPSLQHQSSFPPVFDPRVMTVPLTPVSAGGSNSSSSSYYRSPLPSASSNGPSQPPSASSGGRPPQNSPYGPINGPQPGQVWTTVPPPQRRPSDQVWLPQGQLHQQPQHYQHHPHPPQPPRTPLPAVDTTRHINLQPGETLQSATTTQAPSAPKPTAPPPAAVHMRASDPALEAFGIGVPSAGDGVGERDRYGAVEMRRDGSGGGVPRALRAAGGRTSGGRERDSGSSFASSTASSSAGTRREERSRDRRGEQRSSIESSASASSRRNTPQPSAPPTAVDDGDAYGGMSADEGASTFYHSSHPRSSPHPQSSDPNRSSRFTSPPSSTRSSASGPLTPAQDSVPPVVIQQPDERTVELDEFGDPIGDDAATWFPVNQPLKSPPIAVLAGNADEMGTARAHEWAQAVLERIGGGAAGGSGEEAEQTLTKTLQPSSTTETEKNGAPESTTITPSATTPAPEDDDDESKFADVDEFGDDPADDSTYFAGFGPARPSFSPTDSTHPAPSISTSVVTSTSTVTSPTSPIVGVSLRDEPSSRSPTADRLKRPNLRLKIETPPTPPESHSSSTTGARAGDGKTSSNPSPPSSSSGNLRRAAAAGEPGDLASFMSSRRAERAERIRATASSRQQDSLMALGHIGSHSPNGGMLRRNSFRAREEDDKDWAIRPAVETVLENLDVFFPDVDLDKPVFDLPTPAPSTPSPVKEAGPSPPVVTERSASASSVQQMAPSSTTSSNAFFPSAPPVHPARRAISSSAGLPGATGLSHKKSIRVVAQDRKRAMQKAGRNVVTAVSGLGSNLLRRKSTKLFGARIEEVTSAQLGRISTTIRESPDDDPQNFSYKWIKGDLIGRGTFGHVYIGFSVNTGETIAVKQVELPKSQHDKDDARTKGMVQSLKAEIELLKDLDHPNIVLYLGMEQTPEHLSIFLEYVPGGSVGRIVRTHGKFEENVIKFFTYQILEGLEYLHSLGILHRDMKADNILTDQDGMCKISDFGTSKKSTDIYNNNENMSMQGSIFWMAPEVIHNKNMGYSAKADIWSLGCILIEMFAGRRPWSDEEAIQAMFKLGAERLAPPVPPDVTLSPLAESFLNDCLQIDANDRPKAYQLRDNDFLKLDSSWSFTQTDLYRQMADDEARRRAISSHPSG